MISFIKTHAPRLIKLNYSPGQRDLKTSPSSWRQQHFLCRVESSPARQAEARKRAPEVSRISVANDNKVLKDLKLDGERVRRLSSSLLLVIFCLCHLGSTV